jgi:hypothetical protein
LKLNGAVSHQLSVVSDWKKDRGIAHSRGGVSPPFKKRMGAMRKVVSFTMTVCIGMVFLFPMIADCRQNDNLYKVLKSRAEVKVYVSDVKDSCSAPKADVETLKAILQDAFATRISPNFELEFKENDADIVILCDITEFLWTDRDPASDLSGTGSVFFDVIMKENYARMQATFTVLDQKNGNELWSKKLKATITDREMSQPDSIFMLNERIVKIFMRECFSKHHGRGSYQ